MTMVKTLAQRNDNAISKRFSVDEARVALRLRKVVEDADALGLVVIADADLVAVRLIRRVDFREDDATAGVDVSEVVRVHEACGMQNSVDLSGLAPASP